MPSLPVVPDVVRWDIYWGVGSDLNALTRLHIKYTGSAPNGAACTAIASALYTDLVAEFQSYMDSHTSLLGTAITDLATSSGAAGQHLATTNGTLASASNAANVCALTRLQIARRYRGGKPRAYLPLGDSTVLLNPQQWTASFVSNINASLAALIADIAVTNSGGCSLQNLVNVSYYSGFTVVTNPITGRAKNVPKLRATPVVDDVLAWTCEQTIGSQRRRLNRQP